MPRTYSVNLIVIVIEVTRSHLRWNSTPKISRICVFYRRDCFAVNFSYIICLDKSFFFLYFRMFTVRHIKSYHLGRQPTHASSPHIQPMQVRSTPTHLAPATFPAITQQSVLPTWAFLYCLAAWLTHGAGPSWRAHASTCALSWVALNSSQLVLDLLLSSGWNSPDPCARPDPQRFALTGSRSTFSSGLVLVGLILAGDLAPEMQQKPSIKL